MPNGARFQFSPSVIRLQGGVPAVFQLTSRKTRIQSAKMGLRIVINR